MSERAARVVSRVVREDLSLDRLRRDLDAQLRRLVGWDIAAWATTDPATMLFTSCVLVGRAEDYDVEARLFEAEFRGGDVNAFTTVVRRRPPAGALSAATGGELGRSRRWRTVLAPLGVVDELRVAFVEGDSCWGTLTAYRLDGPTFTDSDLQVFAEAGPLVAAALRAAMLRTATTTPPHVGPAPGVIVLGPDGEVLDVSSEAERWLDEFGEPGRAPSVLRAVAAAVTGSAGDENPRSLPQARVPRRSGGWLRLHGSRLLGSDRVCVVIEPATEIHLADVLVRAYRLTPRERDITELVARGHSTAEIAERLVISTYTVQDHLKSILGKASVSSRRELVAALYGRHYAPATRKGALPSPYGWYLEA